jgi:acetyl-CoA synthetase
MVGVATTLKMVFDLKEDDRFWCTADPGWITGHTYGVYGPLLSGATLVMAEGTPDYPTPSRIWEIVDEHKVTHLYTAPTAVRTLKKKGDRPVKKTSRKSLRVLGTVGEPINPDAWKWLHQVVGEGRCPIMDTYWQTETGAHMLTDFAFNVKNQKPGFASKPVFGRDPVVLDTDTHDILEGACEGALCFRKPWPGMARGVWGNPDLYFENYFEKFPGYFFTSDGCIRDVDGDYKITGRLDDEFKVSGHRFTSEQLESACASHEAVAEAGVVNFPHEIKGNGIYAFVVLKDGYEGDDNMKAALTKHIRDKVGPIATVDVMEFVKDVPKTRSGKIVRRILRWAAIGETDIKKYGTVATLADISVVDALIASRQNVRAEPTREKISTPEATDHSPQP